jgi:hypothetical protein
MDLLASRISMVDVSETHEIDEGLEGVDILDPDAKDVIQVAGDQQTFSDFRMPTHGG